MTPEEIDRATRIYLGIGENGGIDPAGMRERLTAAYGESRAPAIELTLRGYLDQMEAMPVDWNSQTLDEATKRAASFAEKLVPGLTPFTYIGMGNYFHYVLR